MSYRIAFILYFSLLLSFNYSNNETIIDNLKIKSASLIEEENFELALDLYLKILEFEKNIYLENSIELAETYDQIANLYIKLDNTTAALPYLKKSINIYEKHILKPKDKLLSSLKDISIVYEKQNQYDLLDKSDKLIQSLENINDLYSIEDIFLEINILNQTVEDTAFSFIDLAQSYKSSGLYSQSAEYFT